MNLKRLAASALASLTAVVGLSLATAGPAAADAGVWRSYSSSPIGARWACDSYKTLATGVTARVCGIKTVDATAVQTAVVVRNTKATLYAVEAAADLTTPDAGFVGRWECPRSGVGATSYSVCYGVTREQHLYPVEIRGGANGVNLGLVKY
jgi:hypothetical protein